MWRISLFLLFFVPGSGTTGHAQSGTDSILASIEKNNLFLQATRQYWEAEKLEYMTGLTLPNPVLEGNYLFGHPSVAGYQSEFIASQAFDYPGLYKKRKALAGLKSELASPDIAGKRQEILLEGMLIALEWTWYLKMEDLCEQRKEEILKLLENYNRKLEAGEGNILDVNKASLQLLEINQQLRKNAVDRQQLQSRLTTLNGGKTIVFEDREYPVVQEPADLNLLEQEWLTASQFLKSLEQQKKIAAMQVELSKAWRLPKFEAGYQFQSMPGQKFNGIYAGISIPVWEQKNRTEARQAELAYTEASLSASQSGLLQEIRSLFERYSSQKQALESYRKAMDSISNTALLDKALALGEITVFEYFLETSLYFNAQLHYLETELDYHKTKAMMWRFRL